jgi:hypothetical protein
VTRPSEELWKLCSLVGLPDALRQKLTWRRSLGIVAAREQQPAHRSEPPLKFADDSEELLGVAHEP